MLLIVAVVASSTVYKNRRAKILYLILNKKVKVVCSKCGGFSTNLLLALFEKPKWDISPFFFSVRIVSFHENLNQNMTMGSRFRITRFWSNMFPLEPKEIWKQIENPSKSGKCFALLFRHCAGPSVTHPTCAYEYSFWRPGLHFKVSLQFLENIICCYF